MGHRSRGFTLLELIAVIVIFSMLLAISIGYMATANRDLGVSAAAHYVVALLRGAHQLSRGTASPAWVVFRTKDSSVYMLAKETIGEWHFEDPQEEGAFGKKARISGGSAVPGRVGKALLLGGGTADCGEVPIHDPGQGIAVELWVLWLPSRGRQVLCTLGKDLEIAVEGDGKVQGRVGDKTVSSGNLRLPQGAPQPSWCYLQLVQGAGDLRLYLNDRLVDSKPSSMTWIQSASFVVGDRTSGFRGAVDELRVSLIVPRDVHDLPGEAKFELTAPATPNPTTGEYVIHFDAEGRLDPTRHSQAIKFSIRSPAAVRPIVVGIGGCIEREGSVVQ